MSRRRIIHPGPLATSIMSIFCILSQSRLVQSLFSLRIQQCSVASTTIPATFVALKTSFQDCHNHRLRKSLYPVIQIIDDRTRLFSTTSEEEQQQQQQQQSHRTLALEAFSLLAKQGRSWRRLGHLVDMALNNYHYDDDLGDEITIKTIADVGTDHGLLAMGLALSKRFDRVVGVDVSQKALQDGALSLLETVKQYYCQHSKKSDDTLEKIIPVEFYLSNGLEHVKQADAVCIAGMGVHTILKILEHSSKQNELPMMLDLDRIGCQQLLLQPTNSRPRHLIQLYDKLQGSGWRLADERIEKLSSRWYISSCFVQSKEDPDREVALPLSKVSSILANESPPSATTSGSTLRVYEEYLQHHLHWIHQDASKARTQTIDEADRRWLAKFGDENYLL